MSVYYGFFDAKFEESTASYDREYDSADFTQYFGEIIGSGVCIHDNPDSMKVSIQDGSAAVAPGYLFIDGYWLKNDADYVVSLPADGVYAVLAQLDLGNRMIRIDVQQKREDASYPDALVLAFADAQGNVEDTRYDTSLCGVIGSAGSLATKIEFAIQYIDTEIEGRLEQAEAQINAKVEELDDKIAEVDAQVAKLAPPAVGTIKFSASQSIEDGWLKCDGSFVSEQEYPELVAALGKLTPSQDNFNLIEYSGDIQGVGISNFVLYEDYLWTYCLDNHTLYGIPVNGGELKSVSTSSEDTHFNSLVHPSMDYPLALSIVPRKVGAGAVVFIAQMLSDSPIQPGGDGNDAAKSDDIQKVIPIFSGELSVESESMTMKMPVLTIKDGISTKDPVYSSYIWEWYALSNRKCVPYIVSVLKDGVEQYYCAVGCRKAWRYDTSSHVNNYQDGGLAVLVWDDSSTEGDIITEGTAGCDGRVGFSTKNKDHAVSVSFPLQSSQSYASSSSYPTNMFNARGRSGSVELLPYLGPLNIAGSDKMIAQFDITCVHWVSKLSGTSKTVTPLVSSLPAMAKTFLDAAQYLWEKDIYFIFVGTGIIFSRTLETGDFGYLDTTGVLGIITQYGDLRYDSDTGTVYIMGIDSTNQCKAAKIKLDTLYNYANDGAWLPLIASNGVPAYIKAKETEG